MATIKSYTDISQSKTLSKILPLETADMYRVFENNSETRVYYGKLPTAYFVCEPCWSLASLLEEIPEIINFDDDESDYALEILKEDDLYYLSYGNPLEGDRLNIEPQENFVDACVAMIEKLHGLNLL